MRNFPYGDRRTQTGIPVCERAGIAKFAYGDPHTHNEIVRIWGLTYMHWALALRISSSTYVVVAAVINSSSACAWWLINSSCACAQWLMDSSCAWAQWLMDSLCACARWLIACIVVCCCHQTTTQSTKWRSCACAWVAWCRHMLLPQPICCCCSCHRAMQYDNMVCLHTISCYSLLLLCATLDMKHKKGGWWQQMLLLHPHCSCRRCYMTLVIVKTSCRLCLWANRVVVILSP